MVTVTAKYYYLSEATEDEEYDIRQLNGTFVCAYDDYETALATLSLMNFAYNQAVKDTQFRLRPYLIPVRDRVQTVECSSDGCHCG